MLSWEKYKKAISVVILFIILLGIDNAISDVTSSNNTSSNTSTTGNNTSIVGYEQTQNTTYQSGSSSNTTTNSTSTTHNASSRNPVSSAISPSMSVYSQDSCSKVITGGFTVIGFSFSGGGYLATDENCERLKKAKLMKGLGMTVAAISVMCKDEEVWESMWDAGTPCPVDSLIGKEAKKRWIEVGGFHKPYKKKWNMRPIPSGMIKKDEDSSNNN